MLQYPFTLTSQSKGIFVANFIDVIEADLVIKNNFQVRLETHLSFVLALERYFKEPQAIPMPSDAVPGQYLLTLSAVESAKILLWNELLAKRMSTADLARRLSVTVTQVNNLFSLRNSSLFESVERAASGLGMRLTIVLQ